MRSTENEDSGAKGPEVTLVCFAVRDEAAPFLKLSAWFPDVKVAITSIGARNAEKATRQLLQPSPPQLVLSCGFAGGLKADLKHGALIYDAEADPDLRPALQDSGAIPARFVCADRVVTTATEKQALRKSSGADAVEMESGVICRICREASVPSVTFRVVLDEAGEDLPLDFNELLTDDYQLSYVKLARVLAGSPAKVSGLLRLRRGSRAAAEKLAQGLVALLKARQIRP